MGGVLVFRAWQVKRIRSIPFSPQKSLFVSKPPTEALRGKIVSAEGQVEKEARDKTEPEDVKVREEILQGEKLTIGEESQAVVEFSGLVRIGLGSNTKIGFINLLPANFLIHLPTGVLDYQLFQDNMPVSVRSLHVLLTLYSGEGKIVTGEGEITLEIFTGQAKLALVDLENETNVWELKGGDRVVVDDSQRTLISSPE
jgi:hypothetical protein